MGVFSRRLAMGTVMTLDEIRTKVRERADIVNSQFITDPELDGYINQSYFELYDLLIQKYGDNYYVKSASFTTDGSSSQYPLLRGQLSGAMFVDGQTSYPPGVPDFYKLLGVDLQLAGGSPEAYFTIKPFNFAERNKYAVPNMQSFYGLTNLRYRLNGDNLLFTPLPSAGQNIRYWYIPRPVEMVSAATMSISVSAGIGSYSTFLAYDDQAMFITDIAQWQNTYTWGQGYDIPTIASSMVGNYYNGMLSSSYDIAEYTAGTGDAKIYLHSNNSKNIHWDVNSTSNITINPIRNNLWSGVADGVSGWTEYIIVDAAIKAMQKEESDVTVLQQQKMALIQRIEAAAANRDAGNPMTVSDTQYSNYWQTGNQGFTGGGLY
jgi:hypothetical protein